MVDEAYMRSYLQADNAEVVQVNDFVRIVAPPDFPFIPGELPYQKEHRVVEAVGLKGGFLQNVGRVTAINDDGTLQFQDWQKQSSVAIPRNCIQRELMLDVNGYALHPGDKVYVAVKNLIVTAVVVGPYNFKHHGCGWMELGVKFKPLDGGKVFNQFHPKGRVKA